jgi:hypothetical protein
MKRTLVVIAALVAIALAPAAFAGGINLSGPHYNMNIIAVENPKTDPMTGGDGHTIFVALAKNDTVNSRIYLTPGPFQVCDGNAFDAAYDCSGVQVASQGAVFQLPCDSATPTNTTCAGQASQSYQIWARALAKPGGSVTITTCATDPLSADPTIPICSTENAMLSRTKGKQTFTNVTSALTSIQGVCYETASGMFCGTVSLFDPTLENYFWNYANTGLRHLQLRFYPQ